MTIYVLGLQIPPCFGYQFISSPGWWFCLILFSPAPLAWLVVISRGWSIHVKHLLPTCVPVRRQLWMQCRKLVGVLHSWVGFQNFLQESDPNWHHMGDHLYVILPALYWKHLPAVKETWGDLGALKWIDKGLSRVFSNTTVQKHQFFGAQLSSQSNSHIHTWPLEKP